MIDEFADVSSQIGKGFSGPLGRIAAMSRAAEIYLVWPRRSRRERRLGR